jgi:hypothetical protein
MVLPKFGDNFVEYRPNSKILSQLERNLILEQKYAALVSNFLKQLVAVYGSNLKTSQFEKPVIWTTKYQREAQNLSDNLVTSPLIFNIFHTAQRELLRACVWAKGGHFEQKM